ncbi:hypothetical protein ACEQ8H_001656 [Pleosporales sp. CAS-2024a]
MATAAPGPLVPPALPPAPASPSAAKRKHAATRSIVSAGASASAPGPTAPKSTYTLQMVLADMLSVLKRHDTQPSILAHPIPSSITRSSSGEADSKRTKLTPPGGPVTISSLMQSGAYDSLQALDNDIDKVAAEILASSGRGPVSHSSGSLEETALQAKVLAFRKFSKSLLEREAARSALAQNKGAQAKVAKEDGTPVAIKQEEPQEPSSRTVLTLFGSANQMPKQLFSSLQRSSKIEPTVPTPLSVDTSVEITLPLREASLPNIISTTEVFPLPDQTDGKNGKPATIGDVFRAPAHLPQISPPKAARPTTGKSHTITFAPPEVPKPSRKASQSYSHQNLSAGFWLGYAGVDMPKDQSSPTAKQKSRQRALSLGEVQQPPSEASLVAVQQAKEDALFRSAYSSFAPTRDDSTAIVPEETKNRVWWQKVGEKRFNDMFPIDPALLGGEEAVEAETNGAGDEEASFKEAVDNFEEADNAALSLLEEKTDEHKGTDEVLQEISELLETLASYQRIRNSSLTTNPRTPVVQNSSLASLAGSPSTPSTEEFDVYQMLKSQLTLLVSQLPPYAVAKLNGDQLEELNISRTILFDTKEYKGVLEEDTLSRLGQAPPATVAAATPATLHRTSSGTHAHYPAGGNQYGRPSSVHQSSARPAQSAQSFYPQQQQSLHRPSSMLPQRSPSGASHTYQAGGASYAPNTRGYASTQSYSQQTPRPSYSQTPSGQYYSSQRTAQASSYGGAAASQYHGSTPQAQAPNRYAAAAATPNGYMARAQNSSMMYNGSQTAAAPTGGASPLKGAATGAGFNGRPPGGYNSTAAAAAAAAGAGGGGQARSSYYGPSQYGTGQTTSTFGGLAANTQQMMQAQQVAQSQARLAAQNSFGSSSRAGSGTPQPPNGGGGGGGGGGFTGQTNGNSMAT